MEHGIRIRILFRLFILTSLASCLAAALSYIRWTRHYIFLNMDKALVTSVITSLTSLWILQYNKSSLRILWTLTAFSVIAAALYICVVNIICNTESKIITMDWKRFIAPTVVATLCLLTAGAGRQGLLKEFVYLNNILLFANLVRGVYYNLTLFYPNLSIMDSESYLNPQWVPLCGQIVFMVMGVTILNLQLEAPESADLSLVVAHWTLFIFQFGFFATYAITHCFIDDTNDCILTDDGIHEDGRHVWCGNVVNEDDVNHIPGYHGLKGNM